MLFEEVTKQYIWQGAIDFKAKNVGVGFSLGKRAECFENFERNGFNVVKKENPAISENSHKLKG